MGRLLAIVLFLLAGYGLVNAIDPGAAVRIEGRNVIVRTDDFEARFARLAPFSDSYMVFGGLNDQPKNSLTHATVATLAMRHAEAIHQRYPDFHRCSSPGAAQAKRWIEQMDFIGANRRTRKALVDVIDRHERSLRSGGDRVCLRVSGAELALESLKLRADGSDVTQQFQPAFRRSHFYLAEDVAIPDCQIALR
jgi:hypothetical protein